MKHSFKVKFNGSAENQQKGLSICIRAELGGDVQVEKPNKVHIGNLHTGPAWDGEEMKMATGRRKAWEWAMGILWTHIQRPQHTTHLAQNGWSHYYRERISIETAAALEDALKPLILTPGCGEWISPLQSTHTSLAQSTTQVWLGWN